jgi:hypothetical protein
VGKHAIGRGFATTDGVQSATPAGFHMR